MHQTMK